MSTLKSAGVSKIRGENLVYRDDGGIGGWGQQLRASTRSWCGDVSSKKQISLVRRLARAKVNSRGREGGPRHSNPAKYPKHTGGPGYKIKMSRLLEREGKSPPGWRVIIQQFASRGTQLSERLKRCGTVMPGLFSMVPLEWSSGTSTRQFVWKETLVSLIRG